MGQSTKGEGAFPETCPVESQGVIAASKCCGAQMQVPQDRHQSSFIVCKLWKVSFVLPELWLEPVLDGHKHRLKKNTHGTQQASRQGHLWISGWTEEHG